MRHAQQGVGASEVPWESIEITLDELRKGFEQYVNLVAGGKTVFITDGKRRWAMVPAKPEPVKFMTTRINKKLSEITALDIPPGLDARDIASDG